MWSLKNANELIYTIEMNSHRKHTCTQGEREGRINWEFAIKRYKLPYIKYMKNQGPIE